MHRLTNETIADQVASATGIAVVFLSLVFSVPEVVIAVGLSMVFVGGAFTTRFSTRAIPIDKRLPFKVLEFILLPAWIGFLCYTVWPYTLSVKGLLCVLTVAVVAWVTIYKATRHLLKNRCDAIPTT